MYSNSTTASRKATPGIISCARQPPISEGKVRCQTLEGDKHKEDHIGEVLYRKDAFTKTADLHVRDTVETDVDKDLQRRTIMNKWTSPKSKAI